MEGTPKIYFLVHDTRPAFVSWGTVFFVVTESPHGRDFSVCFHQHCCREKKHDILSIPLEGFYLTSGGSERLSLPRRKRNEIFENSLFDRNIPHPSTLLNMRLWGNKKSSSYYKGPGRQSPSQVLVLHTIHLIHEKSLFRKQFT